LALPLDVDFFVAILTLPRHLRDGTYAILFPLDMEIDLPGVFEEVVEILLHLIVSWFDIATRLLCAVLAGVLIGWNRSHHGRAAGLRTTTLVSLAACVSMIQVNLLLPLAGKAPDSFIVMDLMRLPLGILSGMGFIGAGAIMRRDNFVVGVTTAAAMWFVTVIGLCFGGGQILLGLVGLLIGSVVLSALKVIEDRMKQDRLGKLLILTESGGPAENEIRELLGADGFRINSVAVTVLRAGADRELDFNLQWQANSNETEVPKAVDTLARYPGVVRTAWTPQLR
jgi:putative Mg2+ transporter-C (MgtC) family protein